VDVETTQEMYDTVVKELKEDNYDVMIATAAAADWAPERQFNYKVPTRNTPELPVTLKPTPKIIEAVKKMSPKTFLVAFRADHGLSDDALVESAYQRMKASNADLIAANDVGRSGVGFRTDTNELFIIDKKRKVIHIPLSSKREVAKKLIDVIVEKTKGRQPAFHPR
jgi:phosphopantothenoylcysteine decarboxylase/phosphopantothenate--cysteine ligase